MRRPDVFTLDYSHPLADSLWLATLGENPGSSKATTSGAHSYNSGTLANVSANPVSEHLGRRFYSFNGTSSKITYPGVSTFASRKPLSMGGWLRTPNPTKGGNSLISIGAYTPVLYVHTTGQATVYWSTIRSATASPISANTWHHLMMVRGHDDVLRIFLDGRQDPTTFSVNFTTFSPTIIVGNDGGGGWCLGDIADPVLYGRALSPAEIAILADRTDPMLGGLIVEERPVLYFDMGGAGTDTLTALDLVVGSPVLDTPALGQIHALAANNLVIGSPVLGTPTLAENADNTDALIANDLAVGSPVLGTPPLGQIHALVANDLVVGSPVLGMPVLDDGTAQPQTTSRGGIGRKIYLRTDRRQEEDDLILQVINKFLEVV